MPWRPWVLLRRAIFRRVQDDRDLDDELRFHLAQETQLRIERGAPPADAEREARLALGGLTQTREATRAVWVSTRLEQLLQDLRAGSRIVTTSPGLTAAAVVLIALVIGGNTTVFSIVHAILNKPAPGVTARNLVTIAWTTPPDWIEPEIAYANYLDLAADARTVELAGAWVDRIALSDDNGTYALWSGQITPGYLELLGVSVVRGRGFAADDHRSGVSGMVAVISHAAWQTQFHGSPDVVGRLVLLNGRPATIIGVAAPPFRGSFLAPPVDVWVPFAPFVRAMGRDTMLVAREGRGPMLIGRPREGRTRTQVQTELTAIWARVKAAHAELRADMDVAVLPYSGVAGGNGIVSTEGDTFLAIFSVITAITLLIACANVANLLIGRAMMRQRELALRQSLGASRLRVVRLLTAEGLAIALLAWAAACAFAWWMSRTVVGLLTPTDLNVQLDVSPDWAVVGYALVLAMAGMVAFTVGPALRTWRQPLLPWLKAGEQGIVQGRSRVSSGLVVLQLAFSVLLLVAAGLAYRSVTLLGAVDLGYSTRGLLLATIRTTALEGDAGSPSAMLERLREQVASIPGVEAVSYARQAPREFWNTERVVDAKGTDPVASEINYVGPGYLAAFGLTPLAGSDLPPPGGRSGVSALITESLAESLWPGESPLGRTILLTQPSRMADVVGVAPDAFFGGYRRTTRPRIALLSPPDVIGPVREATFHIRYTQPLDTTVAAILKEVRTVDAQLAVVSIRTLDSQLAGLLSPIRLVTSLLALFGCVSLLIAAIGQYAAVSFDMRRRVREFGVRFALGASSTQVLASVLREGFRSTGTGLAIGFLLSAALATALSGILYGVTPTDAVTYGGVFALLGVTSLLACLLPARRAARVDPIRTLRYE